MEAMWNQIELERPPNASWRTECRKFDTAAFLSTLDKIINDLESQDFLHKEAAILSRLVYRMKSKFRNDKGLKSMCKVNRALLNYLYLSLDKEYKNLKSYVELDGKYVILPSRQMVEYVLVRTQGFAKLMSRIDEVATCCAHFFKTRMSSGHAWSISIVAYCVISRIWILSRHLIKKCCTWYRDLYRYLESFKVVGLVWLPKDYQLPHNLKSWLALPWINESLPSVPTNEQLKNTMFKLITTRECGSDEEVIPHAKIEDSRVEDVNVLFDSQEKSNSNFTDLTKSTDQCVLSIDDIGEVIQRRSYNAKPSTESSLAQKRKRTETKINETKEKKNKKATATIIESKDTRTKSSHEHNKVVPTNEVHEAMLRDISTNSDLAILLKKESYPGLDKLRWNMIRKKGKKFLKEINSCPDEQRQVLLLKKAIRRLQQWIV